MGFIRNSPHQELTEGSGESGGWAGVPALGWGWRTWIINNTQSILSSVLGSVAEFHPASLVTAVHSAAARVGAVGSCGGQWFHYGFHYDSEMKPL